VAWKEWEDSGLSEGLGKSLLHVHPFPVWVCMTHSEYLWSEYPGDKMSWDRDMISWAWEQQYFKVGPSYLCLMLKQHQCPRALT
jgi:hypothetical protein